MMSSPLKAVGSVTMKGRRISKKDKSDVVLQPWFQYSSSTDLLPFKDTTQSFIVLQGLKFLFVQTLDISHFLLPLGVCIFFDVRNQAQHFLSRIRLLKLFFSTVILAFIQKTWKNTEGNTHGMAVWEWDARVHPAAMARVSPRGNAGAVSSSQSLCEVSDQVRNSGKQRHAKHFIGQLQLQFLPAWSRSFHD